MEERQVSFPELFSLTNLAIDSMKSIFSLRKELVGDEKDGIGAFYRGDYESNGYLLFLHVTY